MDNYELEHNQPQSRANKRKDAQDSAKIVHRSSAARDRYIELGVERNIGIRPRGIGTFQHSL
jgi:hypothetical protein